MGAGCDPGAAHSRTHGPWLAGSHRGSERHGGHGEIMEGTRHLSTWGSGYTGNCDCMAQAVREVSQLAEEGRQLKEGPRGRG